MIDQYIFIANNIQTYLHDRNECAAPLSVHCLNKCLCVNLDRRLLIDKYYEENSF